MQVNTAATQIKTCTGSSSLIPNSRRHQPEHGMNAYRYACYLKAQIVGGRRWFDEKHVW